MKIVLHSGLLLLLLYSCSYEEKDLCGTYAIGNQRNTSDTILLQPQGNFCQRVYNRNKELSFQTSGKWKIERINVLHQEGAYLDSDIDLIKFPETIHEGVGSWEGVLEARNGTIEFCLGDHPLEACYQRLKN